MWSTLQGLPSKDGKDRMTVTSSSSKHTDKVRGTFNQTSFRYRDITADELTDIAISDSAEGRERLELEFQRRTDVCRGTQPPGSQKTKKARRKRNDQERKTDYARLCNAPELRVAKADAAAALDARTSSAVENCAGILERLQPKKTPIALGKRAGTWKLHRSGEGFVLSREFGEFIQISQHPGTLDEWDVAYEEPIDLTEHDATDDSCQEGEQPN